MVYFDICVEESKLKRLFILMSGLSLQVLREFEREYTHPQAIWYLYVIFLTHIVHVLVLTVSDFWIKADSASLESSVTDRIDFGFFFSLNQKAWVNKNKNHIRYQSIVIRPLAVKPQQCTCIIGIEFKKRPAPTVLFCKAFSMLKSHWPPVAEVKHIFKGSVNNSLRSQKIRRNLNHWCSRKKRN